MNRSYSLVDYFKNGHSLAFEGHHADPPDILRSRSAALLPCRAPTLPATPVDQSVDIAVETAMRRSVHSRIMSSDPSAFRRKCAAESAAALLKQKKEMETLLGDLHPFKDPKDIDKTKRFTVSLRKTIEERTRKEREEYDYNNMKPIEDFLQPGDSSSPRNIGYEHGHIRSLLKLDIYGPSDSLQAAVNRESGRLPLPPNLDRYKDFRPASPTTSRASTASTDEDMWPRMRRSRSPNSGPLSLTQGSIASGNSAYLPNMTANLSTGDVSLTRSLLETKPISLRKPEEGKANTRILTQDRLHVDPFVRRKEFQKQYYQQLESTKQGKKLKRDMDEALRKKAALARAERAAIRDFEHKLALAKFHTGNS